jgi:hypothetical protein
VSEPADPISGNNDRRTRLGDIVSAGYDASAWPAYMHADTASCRAKVGIASGGCDKLAWAGLNTPRTPSRAHSLPALSLLSLTHFSGSSLTAHSLLTSLSLIFWIVYL